VPARYFKLEMIFNYILTLLGLGIVFVATRYGFGSPGEPGPGFFPFFIGLLIIIFGVILLSISRGTKATELFPSIEGLKRFWAMAVAFVVWLLLLHYLGYILITFLITLAMAKIMGLEGWLKPVLLSLGTTVFIYLLFDVWFYTDLPRGILG
jgi:hypothetical protein